MKIVDFVLIFEAMKDGEDVEIGYGGLYDTAIARVTNRIEEDGQTIYRTRRKDWKREYYKDKEPGRYNDDTSTGSFNHVLVRI